MTENLDKIEMSTVFKNFVDEVDYICPEDEVLTKFCQSINICDLKEISPSYRDKFISQLKDYLKNNGIRYLRAHSIENIGE